MISRYRLLHPSRYVPILLAAVAVVMLVPGDSPTGDGTEAAAPAGSVLAVATTPASVREEPPVKIAEVSRRPPPRDVASLPPASAPAAPAKPATTAALSPNPPPATPTATATPAAETPPAAEVEATPDEATPEPETEDAAYQIARVGGSALNVRAGPSSNNKKLFVLRPGEPVRVAEMDGNWARVVRANGDEGWAFARYLTGLHGNAVVETATTAAPARAERAEENAKPAAAARAQEKPAPAAEERVRYARMGSDVAARAAPSAGAAQLFVLPAGSRVKIAEIRGPWAQVVTDSGVSGWVRFR